MNFWYIVTAQGVNCLSINELTVYPFLIDSKNEHCECSIGPVVVGGKYLVLVGENPLQWASSSELSKEQITLI